MTRERSIRLLLSGRVQGVGFRWWFSRQASHLDVRGWVRNLPDGRVEIVAAGNDADLAGIERLASAGPALARVDHVEKADVPHEIVDINTFTVM